MKIFQNVELQKLIERFYLGKKKDYGLDQFYTNLDIAKQCIDSIDITKYDVVIEPSAGAGAFYNQINHKYKMGFDLEPKCDGVHQQDFLKYKHPFTSHNLSFMESKLNKQPKILTIGNPPFGRQGSLAQKFIKQASEFSDTIAFILPRGFKKRSVYDRVPLNFWNVNEIDIPENSFSFNGEPYDVPCVWIEYQKQDKLRTKEKKLTPTTFQFTTQENANVSIRRVGVNAGKTFPHTEVSTPSHYFVKVDNVDEFVSKVNEIKFSNGDTTGPRSIPKNELIKMIEKN